MAPGTTGSGTMTAPVSMNPTTLQFRVKASTRTIWHPSASWLPSELSKSQRTEIKSLSAVISPGLADNLPLKRAAW